MTVLADTLGALKRLEEQLSSKPVAADCDVEVFAGDWGGKMMLVSLSPMSAAIIARQLVQLIERDVNGGHVDIDRASLAPGSQHQLRLALRLSAETHHA